MRSGWGRGLTIAAVVGLAKADAAAVGVVAPAIQNQLHVTDAGFGVLGSLSAATGAICALPAGTLVDRRHRVAAVTTALVLWSLALGAAGFATGVLFLAVARLVSGGVATIARPTVVSLAADMYRPERRARALAALDSGQAVGTAVCFALGALAVHALDWRWLFWWLAAAGVLLAAATRRLDEPARTGLGPGYPASPSLTSVLRALVTIRTNVIVLGADSIGNFFYSGVASFAVLFVSRRYGLSNATVDVLAPLLAVGVVAGILAGGRAGDRLARTGGGARRLEVAASAQLLATALFGVALLCPTIGPAAVFLFLGATVLGAAGPCLDAVRLDIVPAGMRGRAESARGLLMLASSALGPVTFGLVATAFGGRGGGLALRDAFLVMLGPLAAGALMLLSATGPYGADAAAAGHPLFPRPRTGMLEG